MVSAKAKGNAVENAVKKILEDQGFIVMKSPRTMKCISRGGIGPAFFVSQSNDFFNLYDLVAKKKGWTRWIQVKSTSSGTSSAKKPIQEFHDNYNSNSESSEIWQKVPRRGFVVYNYRTIFENWEKIFLDLKGQECEPYVINQGRKKK